MHEKVSLDVPLTLLPCVILREQIEAAFKKFDAAGNGKLNYVEFCDMMNRRKINQQRQKVKAQASPDDPGDTEKK